MRRGRATVGRIGRRERLERSTDRSGQGNRLCRARFPLTTSTVAIGWATICTRIPWLRSKLARASESGIISLFVTTLGLRHSRTTQFGHGDTWREKHRGRGPGHQDGLRLPVQRAPASLSLISWNSRRRRRIFRRANAGEQVAPLKPRHSCGKVSRRRTSRYFSPEAHQFVLQKIRACDMAPVHAASAPGHYPDAGTVGRRDWSAQTFDPTNGLLYVNATTSPGNRALLAADNPKLYVPRHQRLPGSERLARREAPMGRTGRHRFEPGRDSVEGPLGDWPGLRERGIRNSGAQNFGGSIVTAGGLVFIGSTRTRNSGRLTNRMETALGDQLPAAGFAAPCTYSVNGKQYVVIAAEEAVSLTPR